MTDLAQSSTHSTLTKPFLSEDVLSFPHGSKPIVLTTDKKPFLLVPQRITSNVPSIKISQSQWLLVDVENNTAEIFSGDDKMLCARRSSHEDVRRELSGMLLRVGNGEEREVTGIFLEVSEDDIFQTRPVGVRRFSPTDLATREIPLDIALHIAENPPTLVESSALSR